MTKLYKKQKYPQRASQLTKYNKHMPETYFWSILKQTTQGISATQNEPLYVIALPRLSRSANPLLFNVVKVDHIKESNKTRSMIYQMCKRSASTGMQNWKTSWEFVLAHKGYGLGVCCSQIMSVNHTAPQYFISKSTQYRSLSREPLLI